MSMEQTEAAPLRDTLSFDVGIASDPLKYPEQPRYLITLKDIRMFW